MPIETEELLYRAEAIGQPIAFRPYEEQQAIWEEALLLAGDDEYTAGILLRMTLYQYVGGNLWHDSLNVDDPESLLPTDEVLQELEKQSYPLSEKKITTLVQEIEGRIAGYPWDFALYAAVVRDFAGEEVYQSYINIGQFRPAMQPTIQAAYERGWEFYCQTAGSSDLEWSDELVRWRMTDVIDFFLASMTNPQSELKINLQVRRDFARELRHLQQLANTHPTLAPQGDLFILSEHFSQKTKYLQVTALEFLAHVNEVSNEEMIATFTPPA